MERSKRRLSLTLTSEGVFSPCFSQKQASPMTVLSNSMVGLSCMGNTPKRRLSMSSIEETPPAPPPHTHSLSRHSSQSSGVSVGTPSPSNSPVSKQFQPIDLLRESHEPSRQGPLFRRFNSMPLGFQQDSPSLELLQRPRLIRQPGIVERRRDRRKEDEENEGMKEGLWMKPFTKRKKGHESGIAKEAKLLQMNLASPDEMEEANLPAERFEFTKPVGIMPLSAKASTSRTSPLSFKGMVSSSRPISAPASLLEEDDVIELQEDLLTSFHDDDEDSGGHDDDGFSEIFDSENSQEAAMSGFSDGLAGLFHGALISPSKDRSPLRCSQKENIPHSSSDCNLTRTTPSPGPRCRKGIFKVPSQPVLLRRNSSFLKRAERPQDTPSPVRNKRPRSSSTNSPQVVRRSTPKECSTRKLLGRSLSMMSPNDPYFQRIDHSLSVEGNQNDFTGDRTKTCCLQTITGKQKDLKSISPDTMCQLLRGEFSRDIGEYHIIDCRYPYEFNGGHIRGAKNIYQEEELRRMFLSNPLGPLPDGRRRIFVFHCEFSSHRGPKLLRFLRKQDREANLENYPALYYPELYLLNEGYKAFFEHTEEFSEPRSYMPMDHNNHTSDLRHFRAKSKSWTEKSRLKMRSNSLF